MNDDTERDLDEAARRAQAQLNYNTATMPFYVSLGRFLHQYSVLEHMMLIVLMNISGVSQEVGKSLYSGTRIGIAKDFINRILDATNRQTLKEKLKPYFDQIGLLTSMRDDILHYGAVYDFDRNILLVSNERVAHIADRLRTYEVGPKMLDDMAHDANRAVSGLMVEVLPAANTPEFFLSSIASPWRYKPPPPVPLLPNSRRIPR